MLTSSPCLISAVLETEGISPNLGWSKTTNWALGVKLWLHLWARLAQYWLVLWAQSGMSMVP